MASLVATSRSVLSPRYALPFLRPNWSLPCEPSTSSSVLQSTRVQNTFERLTTYEASLDRPIAPWYLSIPSISSLVELFPPILLAVPKHKVTHSRKSMRSANKGLKNKTSELEFLAILEAHTFCTRRRACS